MLKVRTVFHGEYQEDPKATTMPKTKRNTFRSAFLSSQVPAWYTLITNIHPSHQDAVGPCTSGAQRRAMSDRAQLLVPWTEDFQQSGYIGQVVRNGRSGRHSADHACFGLLCLRDVENQTCRNLLTFPNAFFALLDVFFVNVSDVFLTVVWTLACFHMFLFFVLLTRWTCVDCACLFLEWFQLGDFVPQCDGIFALEMPQLYPKRWHWYGQS